MSTVEVVRNPLGGWDVREQDSTVSQSNHETREGATAAAKRAVEVGEADEVEVHEEKRSEVAVDDIGARQVIVAFVLMVAAVTALVVVLSALGIAT